jgi:hypothetical protein
MQYLPFLLLPFVFAATQSLTLSVPSIVSAEKEYEFLTGRDILSSRFVGGPYSMMVRSPATGFAFQIHAHALRHALANAGHDTRRI